MLVASFLTEIDHEGARDLGRVDLAHGFVCCVGIDHAKVFAKALDMLANEVADIWEVDPTLVRAGIVILDELTSASGRSEYTVSMLNGGLLASVVINAFDPVE